MEENVGLEYSVHVFAKNGNERAFCFNKRLCILMPSFLEIGNEFLFSHSPPMDSAHGPNGCRRVAAVGLGLVAGAAAVAHAG
ncbi:MAG: hypothetical protein PHU77_00905 [Simplicispira sp.]|nr:hypothetical protein [Simplicispira sp.]